MAEWGFALTRCDMRNQGLNPQMYYHDKPANKDKSELSLPDILNGRRSNRRFSGISRRKDPARKSAL